MNEERGVWGTFDNGLNLGASQAEQIAAGVNQFDSAVSASSKVFNTRMAADSALGDKLRAQGYYGHGVKSPSGPAPWGLIVNLLVIAVIGWICYVTYGSGKYRVAESSWVNLKSVSVPINQLEGRKYNEPRLVPLFQPGTNLDDLYKGCKTKNCQNPDIQAFDSYRRFAAHPESYESDLCAYYLPSTGLAPEQLQPTWKIDRKFSQCTLTNARALNADVASRNTTYQVKIAVFAAVMLSILISLNLIFRRKRT
jgi:hypothetical protein